MKYFMVSPRSLCHHVTVTLRHFLSPPHSQININQCSAVVSALAPGCQVHARPTPWQCHLHHYYDRQHTVHTGYQRVLT